MKKDRNYKFCKKHKAFFVIEDKEKFTVAICLRCVERVLGNLL